MLARSRALLSIAVLGTLGCNLDNAGDAPPRGLLYFPNAIALSAHDAVTPASHMYVANSNFDLRYRNGSVQSYSLDKLEAAIAECRTTTENCRIDPACVPSDCLVDPATLSPGEAPSEVLIGAFSTSIALSSDGSALLVATRTDDMLSFVGLDPGGGERGCGGNLACGARMAADGNQRSEALAWPGNPVSMRAGPLSDWLTPGRSLAGDYVLVAHRTGAVSLLIYRPNVVNAGADAPGELILTDVLRGLPQVLTEIAYDPLTRLAYLSVAGGTEAKQLARVGVAIPEGADATGARLYNAGTLELAAVQSGNDTRDVTFAAATPGGGAALSEARALVASSDPSALLVVDVDPERNAARVGRVERAVAVGIGPERIVSGVVDGRPLAVVACFLARQLFIIDLDTMLTRSVVPNLSGPFDLVLDEARRLVYVTDFRSSVIRVIDLAPAFARTEQGDQPVRVVATVGQPQVLPELQ